MQFGLALGKIDPGMDCCIYSWMEYPRSPRESETLTRDRVKMELIIDEAKASLFPTACEYFSIEFDVI